MMIVRLHFVLLVKSFELFLCFELLDQNDLAQYKVNFLEYFGTNCIKGKHLT